MKTIHIDEAKGGYIVKVYDDGVPGDTHVFPSSQEVLKFLAGVVNKDKNHANDK